MAALPPSQSPDPDTLETTLLVLHGFTQNGARLRDHLAPIATRLRAPHAVLVPDAPLPCAEASVERMYGFIGTERDPPPYLTWWDATDDGSEYRGWPETRAMLAELVRSRSRVGVLGFSQGAIVAAALAGLSARGEFPSLAFAVLVAGRTPRSTALAPLFETKIAVPSLHVWGERDRFSAAAAAELVERFEPSTRDVLVWPGPHVVPTSGPAADAIVAFVRRHGA